RSLRRGRRLGGRRLRLRRRGRRRPVIGQAAGGQDQGQDGDYRVESFHRGSLSSSLCSDWFSSEDGRERLSTVRRRWWVRRSTASSWRPPVAASYSRSCSCLTSS